MSLSRLEKWSAAVSILMIAASLFWWNKKISLSVLAGVAISAGSFFLLHLLISQAIKRTGAGRAALVVALMAKLGVVGVVLWFVITQVPVQAVAFMIGLSTIIISMAIEACYSQRRMKDV
jgi:hypothetical protein